MKPQPLSKRNTNETFTTSGGCLCSPVGNTGLETKSAVAGSYYKAVMRIKHGCDGDATDTFRVRVPKGMISVKPKSNWNVEAVVGAYQRTYDLHGRAVNAGGIELIWRGSLPNDQFD